MTNNPITPSRRAAPHFVSLLLAVLAGAVVTRVFQTTTTLATADAKREEQKRLETKQLASDVILPLLTSELRTLFQEEDLTTTTKDQMNAFLQQQRDASATAAQANATDQLNSEVTELKKSLQSLVSEIKKQKSQLKNLSISMMHKLHHRQEANATTQSFPKQQQQPLPAQQQQATIRHPSWCPFAVCSDSALCHPCQRRFLIIIAEGRSASTTLTYMMDSLPGIRMSGENANTLGSLKKILDSYYTNKYFQKGYRGAWGHNPIPNGAFACPLQHYIETINPPLLTPDGSSKVVHGNDEDNTIVGFKTIRFLQNGADQEMVQFIKDNFPCSRILVNVRSNVAKQALSQYGMKFSPGKRREEYERDLLVSNERLVNVSRMFGPEQAFLLDSSVWTNSTSELNKAVQWLGFDDHCHFQELLELNVRDKDDVREEVSVAPKCNAV